MNIKKVLATLIAIGAWATSLLIYFLQVTFYTDLSEELVYGAYGVIWFLILYRLGRRLNSTFDALLITLLAAVGLGFTPHRAHLVFLQDRPGVVYSSGGGIFDALFLPMVHFALTLIFLVACRATQQSQAGEGERP